MNWNTLQSYQPPLKKGKHQFNGAKEEWDKQNSALSGGNICDPAFEAETLSLVCDTCQL